MSRRHGRATMPFGKHQGKPVSSIDTGYLSWIAGTDLLSGGRWGFLRESIAAELRSRGIQLVERQYGVLQRKRAVKRYGLEIEESERQLLVLALAELNHARPGWLYACRQMAAKLHSSEMFEEFAKYRNDLVLTGDLRKGQPELFGDVPEQAVELPDRHRREIAESITDDEFPIQL